MATTLSDIRGIIERQTGQIENDWLINVCNDAQSDLLLLIEIPSSATISITTTGLVYAEPANIKRINRMWLQLERDAGLDRDIPFPYRRYNGNIIFQNLFTRADTLTVEFYRHLTLFDSVDDVIDVDDRYKTLYTSYGQAQYYDMLTVIDRIGERLAEKQYNKHYGRYLNIKDQIAAQYTLQTQPSEIKEVY